MASWNDKAYEALERAYCVVEAMGLPLAVVAWLTVFASAIAMSLVLRRTGAMRGHWGPAAAVGTVSLCAHLLDYAVTLRMSPTLGAEGNPIWRIAIDHFGLPIAKVYGLTGKILLAVLAFEFFALYLIQRAQLFPDHAEGFQSFWRGFGSARAGHSLVRWRNLVNFFGFSFALLGPFFFYVALLNGLIESPIYLRLPAMPLVLALYLGVIVIAYFSTTYRAYARGASPQLRTILEEAAPEH
ncbi:MAG: hypothetical protein IH974_03610 [Myxococcales bacterium]|nr:hypothetical protein [Myxococcales bacterium]